MPNDAEEKIILKSRDDTKPLYLTPIEGEEKRFQVTKDGFTNDGCSWSKSPEEITQSELRSQIEPWLTALFQSEHFSLLVGTGLTCAVRSLSGKCESSEIFAPNFSFYQGIINRAANVSNAQESSTVAIEKKLQIANELLIGLKHLYGNHDEKNGIDTLQKEIDKSLKGFSEYILKLEKDIVDGDERNKAFQYLVNFLTSFASRSGTRERLQIFTTNYDRLIETGAEVAGLHLLDRFVGNLSPIFRSSRLNIDMHYNPPGIRGEPRYLEGVAHFTKLHGSVDWIYSDQDVRRIGAPFGAGTIEPYLKALGHENNEFSKLMIYPNAAKDKETTAYPYVELFRDFAASICRPNSSLITYGYSFGDDHINRIIKDMLTIPSTHLVIISYDDPDDRIQAIYDEVGRPAQITLLVGKPFGDLESLVTDYLPKAAIDLITARMVKLIDARLGRKQQNRNSEDGVDSNVDYKRE